MFYFLSAVAIASAIMMLVSKRPVHCLLYLIVCFIAIAGHYLMLNAQFLAMVHIIIYAGAIMVLFLFTLMLLNVNIMSELKKTVMARVVAVISGGLLLITLFFVIRGLDPTLGTREVTAQIGLSKNIGQVLFNEYMIPFEATSLLFLAAMVGAVMMVNKN